jgi:uncharacterized protein (DUF952 family)
MTRYILHIIAHSDWETARHAAELRAPSLETQGFIHFSTAAQVARVANSVFPGVTGLALLVVDTTELTAELRYEPPDMPGEQRPPTGELFPHLYGAMNTDAVRAVIDFPPDADGTFQAPAALDNWN